MNSEWPKIVTMQGEPFSDLHKAGGAPLALCMHLTEKGLGFEKQFGQPGNKSPHFPLVFIGNKPRKLS